YKLADLRSLRFSRPRDIQPSHFVPLEKLAYCGRGNRNIVFVAADMQHRLAKLQSQFERKPRAASENWLDADDERRIAIADVPSRALRIGARGCFYDRVVIGNWAVFGATTARTPPAVQHPVCDRKVERRAVGAGLSARNNRDHARI